MKSKAFTLIELLVVIAIIAILAAILFPVFAQAKAAAKRTADLANVKNIDLGMIMYAGDNDDTVAPMMQGAWDNPRYQIVLWKDAVLPYIKNGGRYIKPDGTPYTGTGGEDGGIFASPTWSDSWAALPANQGANIFGDTSTRFPRSYSLNEDAGINEGQGGSNDQGLWPWVEYWSWETPQNKGGGGSMTALNNPAGTMMIGPTEDPYPNIYAQQMCYGCGGNDCAEVNNNVTVIRSVGNELINLGFFDGHAKAVNGYKSLDDDMWDEFQSPDYNMAGWPGRPQIESYMKGYKEWQQ